MATTQGILKVDDSLKGEPDTLYLTLSHPDCNTKRTFAVGLNLELLADGDIDGLYIRSQCSKCGRELKVQIFRAKKLEQGWTYGMSVPGVDATIAEVKDDKGLR